MDDAPVIHRGKPAWLLGMLTGCFYVLLFVDDTSSVDAKQREQLRFLGRQDESVIPLVIAKQGELVDDIQTVFDQEGMAMSRFDGNDGAIYIIRPD